jgi:predicted nucleic acid-binding protein
MKVLVDTNVILDVLLKRQNFYELSYEMFKLSEKNKVYGYISASAITDIFYIIQRNDKRGDIYQAMDDLIQIFDIAPVTQTIISSALVLHWKDFEDAVQYCTAVENGFDYIVTRNVADYEDATIPCVEPAQFLEMFEKIS